MMLTMSIVTAMVEHEPVVTVSVVAVVYQLSGVMSHAGE
jgi:hypothetical protein